MPRYTQLIFHAGLRKTGTTYLQSILQGNAAILASAGLHFPPYAKPRMEALTRGNHSMAVNKSLEAGGDFLTALSGPLSLTSDCPTLVISAEGVNSPPTMRLLAQAFQALPAGMGLTVPVYLRRYDELVESSYAEAVKSTLTGPLEDARLRGSFTQRLAPLLPFGPGVLRPRPFNRALWPDAALERDFLTTIGHGDLADRLQPVPDARRNDSLSRAQTHLLSQIEDRDEKRSLMRYFKDHPLPLPPDPSRYFLPPKARAAHNAQALKQDAEFFAAYGIADPTDYLGMGAISDMDTWAPFTPDPGVNAAYLADFRTWRAAGHDTDAPKPQGAAGRLVGKVKALVQKPARSVPPSQKN